jgi:hypothetical protein
VGKDAVDQLFDVIEPEDPDATEVDIVLRVHLQPGAGRSAIVGRHGDALKIKVAAAPEGGRANEAVLDMLASVLGVAKSGVSLVSGASSRSKRVRIGPVSLDVVRRVIGNAESGLNQRTHSGSGNPRGGGGR